MDNWQTRKLAMFRRVGIFFVQHPLDPSPPLLAQMVRSLAECAERIEALEQEQGSALRGTTGASVRARRDEVRQSMKAMVRIARPLLAFAPGAERALHVPHVRTSIATTARQAVDLAEALAPHADLLADAGFPADFLAQFTEEARQLGASTAAAAGARQQRSRATADIQRELDKGMGAVTVMDGIMERQFGRTNPEMLKLWRDARRVHARVGRPPRRRAGATREQAASPPAA